jgi:hypothetical protein
VDGEPMLDNRGNEERDVLRSAMRLLKRVK